MPLKMRPPPAADLARCRIDYPVDLARGSSHIGSTLSPSGQQAAIDETFSEFVGRYGTRDVLAFAEILASILEERQRPDAALAVRQRARAL
ncbi:hypothetical protein AB4Y45_40740 [Paraburkholderia sp. EG287A]|uniref:hypothetical protein n=1 Tax=unclassified Paraburkholderia TaxID=2615204 RepID=UPI0034D1CE32